MAQYTFTPTTELTISDISVSATGFSGGSDLALFTFGIDGTPLVFDMITANTGTASASGVIPSFTTSDPFMVIFSSSALASLPVTFTFGFTASEPVMASVPLPATGGLLLIALAGVAAFAAHRRMVA
jgi:hypothetical protein